MTVATKIEPFCRRSTRRKATHAALFSISNESSYDNAFPQRFPAATTSAVSCAASLRNLDSWRVAVRDRNAQIIPTRNLSESTK
jgi:hypothetical protein